MNTPTNTPEPRVARVEPDQADASLRDSFDGFIRVRGKVPNLFRITAQRPAIGSTLAAHLHAVMDEGEVPTALKELLAVRVSQVNGCDYCLASHSRLAKRAGASDAQIAALADGIVDEVDPAWRAPLRAADEMTRDHGAIGDDTWTALMRDWSEPQIVEIVSVISLFNLFNRTANALRIPPTV
jgi:uncharacterized peroxidase-related enzyme